MDNIRPFPVQDNAFVSNLGNVVSSHNAIAGKGINIKHDSAGYHISAKNNPRHENTVNRGGYDFTAEYFPNDIFIVDATSSYVDQNGNNLRTATPPILVGSYVCNIYVPPSSNTSSSFLNVIVPAYADSGATPNDMTANAYRWYQYNNYYPFSGSQTQGSVLDGSGYNIQTSQSFFSPLGAPAQNGAFAIVMYDTSGSTAYQGGTIAYVPTQFTLAGITVLPGTYGLVTGQNTSVSPTGNQIPQIPVPSTGTVYWIPIAAGMVQANSSAGGANKVFYVNATSTF